jgi:hypothetical protein
MVVVTPSAASSVTQGKIIKIQAAVYPATGEGVTWTMTGAGALTDPTSFSVTYHAPSNVSQTNYAVITATSTLSASSVGYVAITVLPFGVLGNQQPVAVDGGPVDGQVYPNGAFTSIKICTPGTLTCNTVDGILVDTGSTGLRILSAAAPSLPSVTDSSGSSLAECVQFPDQSYFWGQVVAADVRIAGEVAASVPVHLLGASSAGTAPADCSSSGTATDIGTLKALGANGILGVGLEPQDCGAACDPSAGGTPPSPAYYTCTGGTCTAAFAPLISQVTHPALLFDVDNNGVSLQFPPLGADADATQSGTLTFGIGTKINNALGEATVFTVSSSDSITTQLTETGQSLTASTIDSGINGLFFPDDNIPGCADPYVSFFCPASPRTLTAVNVGANNATSTINFSVNNAELLFAGNPSDAALDGLSGPRGSGSCSSGSGACSFVWGLPFFYGRDVFVSIRGQNVPLLAPAAPWWAYSTSFDTH